MSNVDLIIEKKQQQLYEEILYNSVIYKFLMSKRDYAIDNKNKDDLKIIEQRLQRLDIRVRNKVKNYPTDKLF